MRDSRNGGHENVISEVTYIGSTSSLERCGAKKATIATKAHPTPFELTHKGFQEAKSNDIHKGL